MQSSGLPLVSWLSFYAGYILRLTENALVFDRMFSLGVRGSGSDASPLNARVVGGAAGVTVAATPGGTGLRRHFLYCSLKPEVPPPKNKGLVGKAREAGGF